MSSDSCTGQLRYPVAVDSAPVRCRVHAPLLTPSRMPYSHASPVLHVFFQSNRSGISFRLRRPKLRVCSPNPPLCPPHRSTPFAFSLRFFCTENAQNWLGSGLALTISPRHLPLLALPRTGLISRSDLFSPPSSSHAWLRAHQQSAGRHDSRTRKPRTHISFLK